MEQELNCLRQVNPSTLPYSALEIEQPIFGLVLNLKTYLIVGFYRYKLLQTVTSEKSIQQKKWLISTPKTGRKICLT